MSAVALPVAILGTHSVLPGRRVTTAEVAERLGRPDDAARIEARTGVRARHWAAPGTQLAAVAAEALRGALDDAGVAPSALRRIILARAGTGDRMFPATANAVAAALGLRGSCDAFDLQNACMGFLSALDLAARSVATGLGPVGVVAADLCSRAIRPSEHRPYMVFGDAAAAAVVGPARAAGEGIVATHLANDGSHPLDVYAEEPSLTGERAFVRFDLAAADITAVALRALRRGVDALLDQAGVALRDVAWVVPHQPNGAMLDDILRAFELDPARVPRVVDEVGSVASASLPLGLDRLRKRHPVRAGDRVLLMGVGGGLSYGATLYRVGGAS